MSFTPLSKIVPKTIKKYGLGRQTRAALICTRYRKIAPKVLSAEIISHAWPKKYYNGVLVIGVEHPAYAAEIIQQKEKLLVLINEHPDLSDGKSKLKDIRTKVIGED